MGKVTYAQVKQSFQKRRDLVNKIKESNPCSDCGRYYPYYVMDFDHLDSAEKSFGISVGVNRKSVEDLLKELGKCELVCSNCHREREQKRRLGALVGTTVS